MVFQIINMKKLLKVIILKLVTGGFIIILVFSPTVERSPQPHTVESSFISQTVSGPVIPVTGSYTPEFQGVTSFTGSWV